MSATVMLACLALQLPPLLLFLYFSLTAWSHYYALLYVPLAGVRLFCLGLYGTDAEAVHRWKDGWWEVLYVRRFPRVAPYLQACGWTILVVAALGMRPVYFWSQVSGYGASPCGRSSCSRDTSLALLTSVPPTVYSPHGYFPRGEHRAFDPLGVASYAFCDFRDACRWADDDKQQVRTYELLAGGCEPNYAAPMPDETGFITRRPEDYPNLGVGVRMGWSPCRRANDQGGTSECPGNLRQATCPPEATGTACNASLPQYRVWRGKRVCSTCSLYENAYKSLFGGVDGFPEFADPDVQCVPKPDKSINPWCFICPGTSETTDVDDLEWMLWFHAAFLVEPLVCMVLVLAALRRERKAASYDDDDVHTPLKVTFSSEENAAAQMPTEAASLSGPPSTSEEITAVSMAGLGSRLRLPRFELLHRRRAAFAPWSEPPAQPR